MGDVSAVEAGSGRACGVFVGDSEESVLWLMDLAEAEVAEKLLPDLLGGAVQRGVASGVVAVLGEVEIPRGDGVDVAAE